MNLREDRVEVYRAPDPRRARYRELTTAEAGACLALVALPGVSVAVSDLLPER